MPKLPDRWSDYSNIGDVIPGTKFITFKVPLQKHFFHKIPEEDRFSPGVLLQSVEEKGLKIGLIIDLTFTKKYYNPKEFTDQGVQYEKIFVPGHVIPSQEILDKFCETVDTFLENSSEDSLVGVHCTHGVNRTGYVVCRYMVDRLGMKATEALSVYGSSRGYPVERGNYIHDLKVRAGEASGEYVEPESEKSNKKDKDHERDRNSANDTAYKNSEHDSDKRSHHHNESSHQGQGHRGRSQGQHQDHQGHVGQYQDHRGQHQGHGGQNQGHRGHGGHHHIERENQDNKRDRGYQHRRGYQDDSYDQYSQNSYVQSGWSQSSSGYGGTRNSYNSGSYGPQRGFLGGWGQGAPGSWGGKGQGAYGPRAQRYQGAQYNYTPYNNGYQSNSVSGVNSYNGDGQNDESDRKRNKDSKHSRYNRRPNSSPY